MGDVDDVLTQLSFSQSIARSIPERTLRQDCVLPGVIAANGANRHEWKHISVLIWRETSHDTVSVCRFLTNIESLRK
jgi:hypothetical protein